MRPIPLMWFLFWAACAQAQPPRPPAGTDVSEQRTVSLLNAVPQPCVEVPARDVAVLLPMAELNRLASHTPTAGADEDDRMARIRGHRAALILKAAESVGPSGCLVVQPSLPSDASQLVAQMLEDGQAAVKLQTGHLAPTVIVRYLGLRCGHMCGHGDITFALPQHAPFFHIVWWIS